MIAIIIATGDFYILLNFRHKKTDENKFIGWIALGKLKYKIITTGAH
ncbi:MAG: hypothetical protein ACJA0T_002992 [Colwellia sp.]